MKYQHNKMIHDHLLQFNLHPEKNTKGIIMLGADIMYKDIRGVLLADYDVDPYVLTTMPKGFGTLSMEEQRLIVRCVYEMWYEVYD